MFCHIKFDFYNKLEVFEGRKRIIRKNNEFKFELNDDSR